MTPPAAISPDAARLAPRRFEFESDSFAFANELHWEYGVDPASGKTTFTRREPQPDYAHRCFVLTRAARQFLYHARFDPTRPATSDEHYLHLTRQVLARSPRRQSLPHDCVVFPGFASLRAFSTAHERLLKAECGGAWRSYVLRSHWRMVFPISRRHQARTATALQTALERGDSPIIHLVRFPNLSINHGMILFRVFATDARVCFDAYDPNNPAKPEALMYEPAARTFFLPPNRYWAGGKLDVIEIYRGWFI